MTWHDLITDVAGLRVGHAQCTARGTGATVLVCDGLWTAAADVRGGGPALREIDVMAPENLVPGIHAVALSGGSVYGLAAADGAVIELAQAGIGLDLGAKAPKVPIVPGAALFDLNGEGDKEWGDAPPYAALGRAATRTALAAPMQAPFALGRVGAGLGARAGLVAGGVGSASIALEHALVVGALVAVNPVGAVGPVPPGDDPFPSASRLAAFGRLQPGTNTTLAVVACNARIDKAEARRIAIMAHDGMARAIRPVHTPFDGDVVIALASGAADLPVDGERTRPWWLARLGAAAADVLERAIVRGVAAAQ
jgi:L-aminopeptidase/D-esterase-like protein